MALGEARLGIDYGTAVTVAVVALRWWPVRMAGGGR
jgi:hypothetical protein